MAFAKPSELAQWLRLPAFGGGSDEEARAQLILDGATGVITAEAEQELEQSETTARLEGTGMRDLVLPRWPVTEVTSVLVDGDSLTADGYTLRGREGLLVRAGDVWPRGVIVKVDFTAGYADIPLALKRVTLELASRSWRNPTGLTSESIGDWSGSWAVPGMSMTAAERRIVAKFAARR